MNERDLQTVREIIPIMNNSNGANKILFCVNYLQISKHNLILLKAFLEELEKKGIFISIDRPHQYMVHLLRLHQIDYSNLFFIDAISRFSGLESSDSNNGENYKILDSPFQIDVLLDIFFPNPDGPKRDIVVDLKNFEFILMDNIASMLNYNDKATIHRFLEIFLTKISNNTDMVFPMLIDRYQHSYLHDIASRLCDKRVDMCNLAIKRTVDTDAAMRSTAPDKRVLDLYSKKLILDG